MIDLGNKAVLDVAMFWIGFLAKNILLEIRKIVWWVQL